jgi:hypothetical protein
LLKIAREIPLSPVHHLSVRASVLDIGLYRRANIARPGRKMKTVVSLAAFAVGALSQAMFEPADFNITEALLKNGVNASAIPELASFAERSLSSGCSAAVSPYTC